MGLTLRIAVLFLVTWPLSSAEDETYRNYPVVEKTFNHPSAGAHHAEVRAHYYAPHTPVNTPLEKEPEHHPNIPAPLPEEPVQPESEPVKPPERPAEAFGKEVHFHQPTLDRDTSVFNPFLHFNRPVLPVPFEERPYHRPHVPGKYIHHRRFPPRPHPRKPQNFEPYLYPLYVPEEIYRILPFYKDHPKLESYALADFYEPEEYAQRQPHRLGSPTLQTTNSPLSDQVMKESNANVAKNTSRRVLVPSSAHNHRRPAVYAVITDEMSDQKMKTGRIIIKDESKQQEEDHGVTSSKTQIRPRNHGIPVPFIKVIRFYPLHAEEDEVDAEEEQPRFISASASNNSKTMPVPSSSRSVGEGTAFARYAPVYYKLPTISPRQKESKAKVSVTE